MEINQTMAGIKKLVMTPYVSDGEEEETDVFPDQTGSGLNEVADQVMQEVEPKNRIKKYALDRQRKLLKIILKLASVNGYDNNERIKLRDGSYLDQSDVVSLLLYTLSPGRKVHGLEQFVDLLKEAGVTSDMVINENVKSMLSRKMSNNAGLSTHTVPKDVENNAPIREMPQLVRGEDMEVIPASNKRKHVDDDQIENEIEINPKRRIIKQAKRARTQTKSNEVNIAPPPLFVPADKTYRNNSSGWLELSSDEEN